MKVTFNTKMVAKVVEALLANSAYKAAYFVNPNLVIRASRKLYNGKLTIGSTVEIILTAGKPNSKQWEFIKLCKKAGEPFPIKKIQLKFPPKKKGK